MRVAVISDTHDLLRPSLLKALEAADVILHAGDICCAEVVETLRGIAPLHVVRGNNDKGKWAEALPETLQVEFGGVSIFMLHDRKQLSRFASYQPGQFDLVIAGHSHRPIDEEVNGQRYFNPGSCGPRRFSLPISMAWLITDNNGFTLGHSTLIDELNE